MRAVRLANPKSITISDVGFNRLRNIQLFYGKIGLMVGAPPTQADCCAWQGDVVPDGQATNAPLSESNMDGLLFYGCQTAIWLRQPNVSACTQTCGVSPRSFLDAETNACGWAQGFLQISNSLIGAQNNEWPSGTYDWNRSAALQMHHAGSLNIVNCDLESVIGEEWIHPGNRLANITSGDLNIVDVTVESESSFHIGGDATVVWRGNSDGGMNGFGSDPSKVPPYFDVAADATGGLLVADQ